jgi:hypothetical protein
MATVEKTVGLLLFLRVVLGNVVRSGGVLWCVCGELRGKRGALDGDFPALKNMPTF